MKIIQTRFLKIILAAAGFALSIIVSAQSHAVELKKADSLFQVKQYTQSFDLYVDLLKKNQYSPATLLKMAFIQEGLGHVSMSLYYLDLYYLASHDEQALAKMEEIANKNRLEGYQQSDTKTLVTRIEQYAIQITAALLAVIVFLFILVVYQKIKRQQKPVVPAFFLMFFLAALFIHLHFTEYLKVGIVSESPTYLMSGPSAGSKVVGIVDEGHQLKILGQTDVWIKVNWKDEEVFINESALLSVRL